MRKVLILGATSAIAQAAARVWAARGAQLHLVARNAERLEAVAADLRTRGASVTTEQADLDEPRAFEPAEIVLFAYGVLGDPAVTDHDPEAARKLLQTNLIAPLQQLTLLADKLAPGSTLAVISSVAGDRGRAKNGVYGASKAGLDAFLSALRQRRADLHILTIKPGFVDTPMTAALPRSPLFASAEAVGAGIVKAVEARRQIVYLPFWWRFIMLVVRALPERIFMRLKF